jgi:hypothetical protein
MTEHMDPYRFPGVTVEELNGKTPAEQTAHIEAKRAEWERKRPLEMTRRGKRSATIAAGGDGEKFDKWWTEQGEQAAVLERANEREQVAQRDTVF